MNNKKVKIKNIKNLSNDWHELNKVNFDYKFKKGDWKNTDRECYITGNGACILLYNIKNKTVILTRQFRMPSYLNGNDDGMMIEVCAGLLDKDDPITCIKKEAEEETGYLIKQPVKVLEAFSSPGAITEKIYYFIAEYNHTMKVNEGGGLFSEDEELEVLEFDFNLALKMINNGKIIDVKTILLLQYLRIHDLL